MCQREGQDGISSVYGGPIQLLK